MSFFFLFLQKRSCNTTIYPLDLIPSFQNASGFVTSSPPFVISIINDSITIGHALAAFKTPRIIPFLKKTRYPRHLQLLTSVTPLKSLNMEK